ncbi:hypothetical protein FNV43_RR18516 [Rhamnella rubrinervis]|uniref:Receptor-like serine/threonine-protein kinase n=1 Tax=Rhamnella rubrinervis TaxID=2594499 RepID=A0A8K0GWH6_9ROSA|nr:hypothetical protein FNV43_RR18516 [Rhamnella rubrinervis]
MASIVVLFLLASESIIIAAQQRESNIIPGSSLTPITNSSWLSNSGLYAFGFYDEGNGYAVGIFLAGIPQKTVVWTANRDGPPVSQNSTLLFTNDGRLVLQSSTQRQDYNIGDPLRLASSASMLDSGNFVLYNSSRSIIWQSVDHPTDTLLQRQRLLPGKELVSSVSETDHSTGKFRLAMQEDGHLVQYPANATGPRYAYYASGTFGKGPGVTLNLDAGGHLYLLNATDFIIMNLTQGEKSTKKQSTLCAPMGLCGVNSFCVPNGGQADCICLPGSKIVDKVTAGCEKISDADGCGNNQSFTYAIQELQNTTWDYSPYSIMSLSEKKDCEQACLEDCNCDAAFFDQDGCRKQKFPLNFVRQLDPRTALIKVATAKYNTSDGFAPKEENKKIRKDILIIGVSLAAFGLIMSAITIVVLCKGYIWAYEMIMPKDDAKLNGDLGPRSYSYFELERMTEGFKDEIGRGAFGTVYKGVILNNIQKVIAVKRLDKVLRHGEKEFQTEMKVIGKTHHRNLVRLIGFCLDGPNRLLVYEYMSNGSLADTLFAPKTPPPWEKRMQIAHNIARGILYLHEECMSKIIHCDIKPQNILLDENGCAKISDFGLAKLLQPDQTRTFTGIRGTRGYVAPEWHRKLPITGVDWNLPEEEAILDEWVYRCFENGELGQLVGEEEIDMQHFERMIKVGLWCIQYEPSLRPTIKMVLHMLEGLLDVPIPPASSSRSVI